MLSVIETNSDEEKIVQLLSRCCATSLREEYIKRQNEKNIELLKMAKELNSQHKLRLNFQDKSISEIRSDVKKEIDALHDYEENISKYGMYELKHYTI